MSPWYYPGCTLKTTGRNFESSALASMEALGHPLEELPRWNCCGTIHSLASDDLIHHLAPVRILIRVKENGGDEVVTLCAMCYNTLRQADRVMNEEPDKRDRINNFMDSDEDYDGSVRVLHLLEYLRDEVGFDAIKEKIRRPLEGLKVSPYYGCLLLRPRDVAIDDIEAPRVMEDLVEALGGTVVDSPMKIECCGSYHTVDDVNPVVERGRLIIGDAADRGADAIAVGCPLCFFNLDRRQRDIHERYRGFPSVPIFYFTQLLAAALGVEGPELGLDLHTIDPAVLLRGKDEGVGEE